MRRTLGPAVIGIVGVAILCALGVWQVQRLNWKTALLSEIETTIADAPSPLPADPDPVRDRFRPVEVTGRIGTDSQRVVTTDEGGAAFRVVAPFETAGRRLLLDRGVISADAEVPPPPSREVRVVGNLHWPDEQDGFTPPPDPAQDLWYARDLAAMARELDTEPLLVVARDIPGDPIVPRPIDTAGIPNNHLEYAITWFSLAAVWAGMTLTLLWRIRRRFG